MPTTTTPATTVARIRAHALLKASRTRSAVRDQVANATSLDRRVEGALRAARKAATRPSSLGAPVPKTQ